jgi:hypothetical protein
VEAVCGAGSVSGVRPSRNGTTLGSGAMRVHQEQTTSTQPEHGWGPMPLPVMRTVDDLRGALSRYGFPVTGSGWRRSWRRP